MDDHPGASLALMDCCRVADRLPVAALAREWGCPVPAKGGTLALTGPALAAAVRREQASGSAFLHANGCLVTAGMDPRDTQELTLALARRIPGADLAQMVLLREVRSVPHEALEAQARALADSVSLDALERQAELLLTSAGRSSLASPRRRLPPGARRNRQRLLGQVVACRYHCAHAHGAPERWASAWDPGQRAAYRRLAAQLQLPARTEVLSHKLDQLEAALLSAGHLGRTGGMLRQLWLEVWLLALFPLAHLVTAVLEHNGLAWLRRWVQQLLAAWRLIG